MSLEKEEETDDEMDSDDFGADRDTEFERKMDDVIQNKIEEDIKDVEESSWISGADIGAEMMLNIAAAQPMTKIPTATSQLKKNQLDQENALRRKSILALANYRHVKKGHANPAARLVLSYLPVWKICDFGPSKGALNAIIASG